MMEVPVILGSDCLALPGQEHSLPSARVFAVPEASKVAAISPVAHTTDPQVISKQPVWQIRLSSVVPYPCRTGATLAGSDRSQLLHLFIRLSREMAHTGNLSLRHYVFATK